MISGPSLQQLRPWHRSMARDMIAGVRPHELAERYGYTDAMITRIINSPLFQAEMSRLEAQNEHLAVDVSSDLKSMAPRAAEILDRELDRGGKELSLGDRRLQVDVARDILDRAGHAKRDNPLHLHKHEHFEVKEMTDEELYRDVVEMLEEEQ